MTKKMKSMVVALFLCLLCPLLSYSQMPSHKVEVVGAIKNTMWKGQLGGLISLDTLAERSHLYGIGPLEYLSGEIAIMDGVSYLSTVVSDSLMKVEETYDIKAPFFGYASVPNWEEKDLPDTVQTMAQLEKYLDVLTASAKEPFLFKLKGWVNSATIHIMNVPRGFAITSPKEAHASQVDYFITHAPAEMIGFFSQEHQGIFTHHDTFLHMHLITDDKKAMGHLDDLELTNGGVKLFLPKELLLSPALGR